MNKVQAQLRRMKQERVGSLPRSISGEQCEGGSHCPRKGTFCGGCSTDESIQGLSSTGLTSGGSAAQSIGWHLAGLLGCLGSLGGGHWNLEGSGSAGADENSLDDR
jgi:hypothetical protein